MDSIELLFRGPFYVKIPGSQSKIIRGYFKKDLIAMPTHIPIRRAIRILLPASKLVIARPISTDKTPGLNSHTHKNITIADSKQHTSSIEESNAQENVKPSIRIHQQASMYPQHSTYPRQTPSQDYSPYTGQVHVNHEFARHQSLIHPGQSYARQPIRDTLDQGPYQYRDVRLDEVKNLTQQYQLQSQIVNESADDHARGDEAPHSPPVVTVKFPKAPISPLSAESTSPENESTSVAASISDGLFEEHKTKKVPRVKLPPASVYAAKKSPHVAHAKVENIRSPPIVSSPVPPPASGDAPTQSATPDASYTNQGPIPVEYRLTPDVMHQPRPTKVVSVADIEPPALQNSPLDGQQHRYGYNTRSRGFSNGHRGSRHDYSENLYGMCFYVLLK